MVSESIPCTRGVGPLCGSPEIVAPSVFPAYAGLFRDRVAGTAVNRPIPARAGLFPSNKTAHTRSFRIPRTRGVVP